MPTPRDGYFSVTGEKLPGCTTILSALSGIPSDVLCHWAVKLSKEGKYFKEERQRAADVGTFVHDVNEKYPDAMPPRPLWMANDEWQFAVGCYAEYAAWRASVAPVIVAQEVQLVSEVHRCGGTFDLMMSISNELVIGDHKTGKTVDLPKVAAQLAFYGEVALEVGLIKQPVRRGVILHYTRKETREGIKVRLKPIELDAVMMAHGFELFKTARRAYDLFKSFPRAA